MTTTLRCTDCRYERLATSNDVWKKSEVSGVDGLDNYGKCECKGCLGDLVSWEDWMLYFSPSPSFSGSYSPSPSQEPEDDIKGWIGNLIDNILGNSNGKK